MVNTVVPALRGSGYLLIIKPYIGSLSDACETLILIEFNLTHVYWAECELLTILATEQKA